jgi:replicative superfamily II helicase
MEIVKDELQEVQQVPTFDPNKKYTWAIDSEFTLSGNDFGILLNSLRAILSTEEAQRILLADKASQIMEATLAEAVQNGSVVEVPEQ